MFQQNQPFFNPEAENGENFVNPQFREFQQPAADDRFYAVQPTVPEQDTDSTPFPYAHAEGVATPADQSFLWPASDAVSDRVPPRPPISGGAPIEQRLNRIEQRQNIGERNLILLDRRLRIVERRLGIPVPPVPTPR